MLNLLQAGLSSQPSMSTQPSNTHMIGEETPAAFVHPAEEVTAIQQPDGAAVAEARPHHRSSPLSDSLPMEDEVSLFFVRSIISHHDWLGSVLCMQEPPRRLWLSCA